MATTDLDLVWDEGLPGNHHAGRDAVLVYQKPSGYRGVRTVRWGPHSRAAWLRGDVPIEELADAKVLGFFVVPARPDWLQLFDACRNVERVA